MADRVIAAPGVKPVTHRPPHAHRSRWPSHGTTTSIVAQEEASSGWVGFELPLASVGLPLGNPQQSHNPNKGVAFRLGIDE